MNTQDVAPGAPSTLPAIATPRLRALCSDLQSQGYTALLVAYSNGEDTDVRLLVSCEGAPIVEVLGPYNGICDRVWWHAVRIDPEQRSVWRGPPRCCDDQRVIVFVQDLLMAPPERLVRRYRALDPLCQGGENGAPAVGGRR